MPCLEVRYLCLVHHIGDRRPALISRDDLKGRGSIVAWCYWRGERLPLEESDMMIGSTSKGVEDGAKHMGLQREAWRF